MKEFPENATPAGHVPEEVPDLAFDDQPMQTLLGLAGPQPPTPADAITLWRSGAERTPAAAAAVAGILGGSEADAADLAGVEGVEEILVASLKSTGRDAKETACRRATLLTALGSLLGRLGRLDEAEAHLREAVELMRETWGRSHPRTCAAILTLADILQAGQRTNEADALRQGLEVERLVQAQLERVGGEHPEFMTTLVNSAHELRKAGLTSEAESFDRRAVALSERLFGMTHPLTIHRRNNLAISLLMLGRLDEAAALLEANILRDFPPFENLTPRLPYLLAILNLVAAGPAAAERHLAALKAHLDQPPLAVHERIQIPWDLRYLLETVAPRLPTTTNEMLSALLLILNARCQNRDPEVLAVQLAALKAFPIYRDAKRPTSA